LGGAGTDFFLHLGDFSYGAPVPGGGNTPADWCNFVRTKGSLPPSYPYELLSGGHSSQAAKGQDGPLESYTACLPDQLHSTIAPGEKHCEISADLFNLLIQKHVDLVLQGHEHGYERSGQFALNPTSCPAIPLSSPTGTPTYSAGCTAEAGPRAD